MEKEDKHRSQNSDVQRKLDGRKIHTIGRDLKE